MTPSPDDERAADGEAQAIRILLAIAALVLVLVPGTAPGADVPPAGAGERPGAAPGGEAGFWDNAVDRTHGYLLHNVDEAAAWFDGFFGAPRIEEAGLPGSFVKWRNGLRWSEGGKLVYKPRLHVNLRLPEARRRLRLLLTGEEDEDARTPVVPSSAVAARPEPPAGENRIRAELIYDLVRRARTVFNVRAGVKLRAPVDPYVKAWYQYTRPLGSVLLLRFTEEVPYTLREGAGETTRIDLERRLSSSVLLRWSSSGTYSETSAGYEWGTMLGLFCQLTPKTAIALEGGPSGATRPAAIVTNWIVRSRFRQNVFRPWLFYEIEPEVSWPRERSGVREPDWAGTFVVEVRFGSHAKAPAPAEKPPEAPGPAGPGPAPLPPAGDGGAPWDFRF